MKKTVIKLGILYALYRFVPVQAVKAMALGVAGVTIAAQVPYLNGVDASGKAI